jgi:hypothetical protein
VTRTVGIPGTGIYYTERSGRHTGIHTAHRDGQGGVLLPLVLFVVVVLIIIVALAVLYQ